MNKNILIDKINNEKPDLIKAKIDKPNYKEIQISKSKDKKKKTCCNVKKNYPFLKKEGFLEKYVKNHIIIPSKKVQINKDLCEIDDSKVLENSKLLIKPIKNSQNKLNSNKIADKNFNSNEQTNINSSQRNEQSNHQSHDNMREVKLNIEDNLKNLLNFSYENFLSKERESSDTYSRKSIEKSNLTNNQSMNNNENNLENIFSFKRKNKITFTSDINLEKNDYRIGDFMFKKSK